jgi:Outer membrane protein beta-barrel domain
MLKNIWQGVCPFIAKQINLTMKQKISLFTTAFLFLTIMGAQAQKSFIMLRGGLNIANVTTTNDGDIDKANSLASFQVGLIGNLHFVPFLSLQTGLVFTGKGSKTQAGSTSDVNYYRATSNPYYLEVPVNLIFKTPTGPVKFFAGAGPYIAMGIAGKNKVNGKFAGTSFSSEKNIEWSNDDPSTLDYEEGSGYGIAKRFDYGLNGIAGIELLKAVLSVNYGFGLAKLQSGSNSSADDSNKNRVLSFTVGLKL